MNNNDFYTDFTLPNIETIETYYKNLSPKDSLTLEIGGITETERKNINKYKSSLLVGFILYKECKTNISTDIKNNQGLNKIQPKTTTLIHTIQSLKILKQKLINLITIMNKVKDRNITYKKLINGII